MAGGRKDFAGERIPIVGKSGRKYQIQRRTWRR